MRLLLVSSSTCHPGGFLDHCEDQIRDLFDGVGEVMFVPYARPSGMSHTEYTGRIRTRFKRLDLAVRGLEEFDDPRNALQRAEGVFVGGGNTFVLLRQLHELQLLDVLRQRVLAGAPYLGSSAGSNLAGMTIGTSNDMPIVHPPGFEALALAPFNLNPHYPRDPPDPRHQGETRETRIKEFHVFNSQPVVALREDSMLDVRDASATLLGELESYLFRQGQPRSTLTPGDDVLKRIADA